MAVSITSPATANINDTTAAVPVSYTGGIVNGYVTVVLSINGYTIQTVTRYSTSGTNTLTPVNFISSIWQRASGKTLSGCVTITATAYDIDSIPRSSASITGSLTILTRLSNFSNNGANVNLDGSSYIKGSWSNPNSSYFRGNFRAYVDGNVVNSASQQQTFYDRTVASGDAWYTNFNNAIGSSSSKTITYTLTTQFNTGSWGDIGGSVGSYTGTLSKSQYYKGTLSSLSNYTVSSGLTVTYSGADGGGGSGITYSVELKIGSTVVAARSNLSSVGSSISITEDEKNAMFSTLNGSPSATTTLVLATYVNGNWLGESTASATVYNVVATITSFVNTERSGTTLSYSYATDTSVDIAEYKIGSSGSWVTIKQDEDHTSGVFTITDLAPSTSYTVYIRVRHTTSEQYTTSNGLTVTTVNTSVITNTPNFNIDSAGVSIPLEISKVNTNMRHTVTLKNVAETVTYGTSAANIDTTGSIILSAGAIDDLYEVTANSKTVELVLVCESLLSGVSQGFTRKTIVGTVINSLPTIGNATYIDTNSYIQSILGDDQKILQSLSTLRVNGYTMASLNYATLSSLVVNFGGNEYAIALSGTSVASKQLDVGTINVGESGNASVYVVDSRGYTSTPISLPISVIAYVQPLLSVYEISRRNNYYDDAYVYAKYQVNSVITNSIQHNTVDVEYRYKLSSSETWSAWEQVTNPTPSLDGVYLKYEVDNEHTDPPIPVNYIFGINNVYNIEYRISDTFTTTPVVFTNYIPKGMGHIEFYENRVNFGVQPYFTNLASEEKEIIHEDNLAIVLQAVYPVGSIYTSTVETSPSVLFGFGTWETFGSGKVLIGHDPADSDFNSIENTGGDKTHTHSIGAHTHGLADHTHSVPGHSHSIPSHTHSTPDHSHGLGSGYAMVNTRGTATAGVYIQTYAAGFTANERIAGTWAGNVNTAQSTSAALGGSTSNGGASTTGGWSGTTGNSSSLTSGAASGNTSENSEFDSGSASSLPPYVVVKMWKRTA